MKSLNVLLVFIAVSAFSGVAPATPGSLTYQGRIKSIQGAALEHNGVLFEFSITNPQGSCVIYRETSQALDMRNSAGVFDVPIGTGSKNFPAAAGFKLLDAFENSGSFSCEGGGTYTPITDDKRLLRVQFYDGTGWRLISPDSEIRSVPYAAQSRVAQSAQKLGTLLPTDVVSKTDLPVCPAGQYLRHVAPAGTFLCESVTVTGGNVSGNIAGSAAGFTGNLTGDVTGTQSATSVDRIRGTPVTSTGLATGKVLKYDGTNWAPADDETGTANAITGLSGDVSSSGAPTATVTIGNNVITTTKIQDGAVNSAKIADGSIVDDDISAGAAIADSKLATIATAGKVSGSAITSGTIGGTTAINTSGLIQTSNGLRVYSGSNYVELKAPALSQNTSYELPAADGGNGQVLTTDGTGKLNWTTIVNSGGTVTGVTATSPLASSGGTAPVISLNDSGVTAGTYSKVTVNSKGLITTAGNLTATDLPNLAGDVTSTAGLSNTKVEKIQSVSVASTTPVLGQVLMHDASKWNVQYFGFGELRSTVTGNAQMPSSCATANKTLNWSAITDTFTCTDIAIANTQVSGLGTASTKNFGTSAGQLVELDGTGRIPASLMPTTLTATSVTASTVTGATLNGSLFFLDGTAAGWTNATIRNQAVDGYSGIGLVDNTGNNKGYLAYANSAAGITPSTVTLGTMATTVPLTFSIGGNEAMRVAASTGNVGIGSNNPTSKLEVNGVIHSSSGGIKFPDGTTQTTAYSASGATSGIVLSGTGRRYFDGSYATSCLSYLNGTGLYSYAGSIGDGVYTIDPDGAGATAPFDVWCSMSQGGWTYPPISKVIVSKNYNNTADSLSMEPESAFANQDISLHSTTGGSTGSSWHGGCVIVDTSGISHSDVNLLWQASYLYGSAQSVAVSVSASLVNYQNTPYNRLTPPDVTYFSTTNFVEARTDTTTGIGHDTTGFNGEFRSVLFGKYSLKTQGRRYIYVCTASYNAGQWHAAKIKVRFK